jgi:branched-chain amino acid transport system substrate-binding protein
MVRFTTFFLLLLTITATARAEISIAVAGPITGPYASIGEQLRRGATMAVADINAAGGLLGQPLSLRIMDDVCDPKQATLVASQLVNDNAAFVAGHFCSSASIPASNVYNDGGVIMISPASTSPTLTERGLSNVFRVCGRDDQQGVIAADYIARHFGDQRLAIIHDKTSYGKGLADVTKQALNNAGIHEVLYEGITTGERDFTALITRMKYHNIGVMYVGGYFTEAGLLRRQAHDQGLKIPLISGDALVTREYWTIAGKTGEGTLMTFSPDPRNNPEAAKVVQAFRDKGYEPEGYTLYNYAAVQVYAQAAKRAGSTDPKAIRDVMHGGTFHTLLGPITFDAKGDVTKPQYVVYQWSKGEYRELVGDGERKTEDGGRP